MLQNYFRIAWRNLVKRKTFSIINIFGLAVSIACCMLICAYLFKQLNYDTYAKQANQIYRIELHSADNGAITVYPNVDAAVGQGIKDAFPEVLASVRMITLPATIIRYDDKQFKEEHIASADAGFLKLFSIPLIKGDISTALADPNSIVISKSLAKKYFGDEDPLGKQLFCDSLFKVTGVFDKVPDNSHFHFDALTSFSSYPFSKAKTWSNVGCFTYLFVNKNTDIKLLESKIPQLAAEHVVPEIQRDMGVNLAQAQKSANSFRFLLRPITSIHLYSHTKYELEPGGDIQYVYIFGALAFFILLLACVNFVNLATASSAQRSREVGIRKVLGSFRNQLIFQFLSESVLVAFYALIIALIFVFFLLPWFNQVSGEHINFSFFLHPVSIISIVVFTLFVGIVAGIYPAFFLSGFKTIQVLKGGSGNSFKGKSFLRNGLVVFQFTISIVLIISTIIVYQQLHFMQNKNVGYDKEQVLVIPDAYLLGNNQYAFKQQLLNTSGISGVSISMGVPASSEMDGTQIFPLEKKDVEDHSEIHTNIYHIDYDYINVMGMKMANGRNFSKEFRSDSSSVLINESAAKALGWNDQNALGKTIVRSGQKRFKVVGVVKDFQYASAKNEIAPLIMMLGVDYGSFLVKIKASDINRLITDMKKDWNSFNPSGPFSYSFLDETFDQLYRAEERTGQIFTVFALVAIIIASLGLLGLVAYTADRRTKEIGVRKVLGSSVQSIIILLTKDFVKLILLSTLIAVPVAWWTMHLWLQNYAFRIQINWAVFLAAIVFALLVALVTIGFQAIKAAVANPIKSLRTE